MSPSNVATFSFSGGGLQPWHPGERTERITLKTGNYPQGALVGEAYGTDEVDVVTITGAPTGGTFTVSVQLGTGTNRTSAAIPFNATPDQVQAAVNALVNVAGDAIVRGDAGGPYLINLSGPTVGAAVITVAASGASLTGGTTPAATARQVTAAAAGTPGQYGLYGAAHTDGTQWPTHIVRYACQVDASGNVSFVDTPGALGDQGVTELGVPAFYGGSFAVSDLSGLDDTAIARLGRMLSRSVFLMYS
jgi:hypothetical protein